MGIIFVVSPDYLEALYKEASKYKFGLQGYGNFKQACSGIYKTNPLDVIGYAIVSEALPELKSSEGKSLLKLLTFINDFETPKNLIFATNGHLGVINALARKFPRINISYVVEKDAMTDIVINRDIFGSLLLGVHNPYIFEKENGLRLGNFTSPVLQYKPLFSPYVLQCLDNVSKLETIQHTIEVDLPYQEYVKSADEIMQLFRKWKIYSSFSEDFADKEKLRALVSNVTNTTLWCTYKALEKILGGDENV